MAVRFIGGDNLQVDKQTRPATRQAEHLQAATTAKGYTTVASNKGDVHMFDPFGIVARTNIAALGDPIIGFDITSLNVTADTMPDFVSCMKCGTWQGVRPSRRGSGLPSLGKDF